MGDGITDYAKDAIIGVLQEFFAMEKNVGGDLLFNRDLAQSRILIADKYTINMEDVEKKPSIVVIRGAQSWGRRGIDQFQGWSGPNVGSKHTDLIQGSFNCTCMSRQGLEAEKIAFTVFGFFSFFKKVLRDIIKGMHDIQGIVLGEELVARTDSEVDISVVPVSVSLLFQWSWLVERVGPPFRDVSVNASIQGGERMTRFLRSARPALVT